MIFILNVFLNIFFKMRLGITQFTLNLLFLNKVKYVLPMITVEDFSVIKKRLQTLLKQLTRSLGKKII